MNDLAKELLRIARRYPDAPLGAGWFTLAHKRNWAERTAFDIQLVTDRIGTSGTICDIGGGSGLFAIGCAQVGLRAILVDDLAEMAHQPELLTPTLALLDEYGVEVRRENFLESELDLGRLDAATAFHVLEHMPASPKPLLHKMRNALRPGGVLVLAGPNNVNLRKRITVPLGKGAWSSMADWYEADLFRGHVREPNVSDLFYMASDLELQDVRVYGRNFLGLGHESATRRALSRLLDRPLRARPSLCSDIYMVGTR